MGNYEMIRKGRQQQEIKRKEIKKGKKKLVKSKGKNTRQYKSR